MQIKPVPLINSMFTFGFAAESKHASNHKFSAKIVTIRLLLCTMPSTCCALMCLLPCTAADVHLWVSKHTVPHLQVQLSVPWHLLLPLLTRTFCAFHPSVICLSMLSTSAKLVESAVHLTLLPVCRTYGGCSSTSWQYKWQVPVLSDTPPEHPSPHHKQQ